MTIEKPFYTAPSGDPDKDPQYIDPKELEQIFKSLPVSDMAKVTPAQYEYILQRYEDYVKNDGKLDFKQFVIEFFEEDFRFKKGGLVKWDITQIKTLA